MMLLTRPSPDGGQPHAVLILGGGLIGGAIEQSLVRRAGFKAQYLPLDWSDAAVFDGHFHAAVDAMTRLALGRLDWVWAAGRAGFGADEPQVQAELTRFEGFLNHIRAASTALAGIPMRMHLISSAGGLYEGCRSVTARTEPRAERPYGILKMQQEQLAREHFEGERLHIYRPSSVYGFIRPNRRNGLAAVMIANALLHRTTTFSGRLDTLRDYVWVDDLADFVTQHICDRNPDPGPGHGHGHGRHNVYLLASARPTSIHEMRTLVEHATRQPVYIQYLTSHDNAEHITFSPSALPPRWYPSEPQTNIRRMVMDALASGCVMHTP